VGQTKEAHLWAYVGDADWPYAVFDFTADDTADGPEQFLKGYKGYLAFLILPLFWGGATSCALVGVSVLVGLVARTLFAVINPEARRIKRAARGISRRVLETPRPCDRCRHAITAHAKPRVGHSQRSALLHGSLSLTMGRNSLSRRRAHVPLPT
jgi:hypothetical protein